MKLTLYETWFGKYSIRIHMCDNSTDISLIEIKDRVNNDKRIDIVEEKDIEEIFKALDKNK